MQKVTKAVFPVAGLGTRFRLYFPQVAEQALGARGREKTEEFSQHAVEPRRLGEPSQRFGINRLVSLLPHRVDRGRIHPFLRNDPLGEP